VLRAFRQEHAFLDTPRGYVLRKVADQKTPEIPYGALVRLRNLALAPFFALKDGVIIPVTQAIIQALSRRRPKDANPSRQTSSAIEWADLWWTLTGLSIENAKTGSPEADLYLHLLSSAQRLHQAHVSIDHPVSFVPEVRFVPVEGKRASSVVSMTKSAELYTCTFAGRPWKEAFPDCSIEPVYEPDVFVHQESAATDLKAFCAGYQLRLLLSSFHKRAVGVYGVMKSGKSTLVNLLGVEGHASQSSSRATLAVSLYPLRQMPSVLVVDYPAVNEPNETVERLYDIASHLAHVAVVCCPAGRVDKEVIRAVQKLLSQGKRVLVCTNMADELMQKNFAEAEGLPDRATVALSETNSRLCEHLETLNRALSGGDVRLLLDKFSRRQAELKQSSRSDELKQSSSSAENTSRLTDEKSSSLEEHRLLPQSSRPASVELWAVALKPPKETITYGKDVFDASSLRTYGLFLE